MSKVPFVGALWGDGVRTAGAGAVASAMGYVAVIEGLTPIQRASIIAGLALGFNFAGAMASLGRAKPTAAKDPERGSA